MIIVLSVVFGAVLVAVAGWLSMPRLMIREIASPYDLDQTVETIKQNALVAGWVVPSITPMHESVKKNGGGTVLPVMLVNLCEAHHASHILSVDGDRKLSVMMPCTISAYNKQDGGTYIGYMNASLMGWMFGGNIARVMSAVSKQQQSFIAFAR